MARSRNIKPAIMDNEDLAALDPLARLLFIYLWMLADRDGRLEDRPGRIAHQALGYDRTADVGAMLDDLQRAGFVARYTACGKACIQILQFTKHQTPHVREAASELPGMTDLGEAEHQPRQVQAQLRDDTHLAESVRRMVIDRDGGKCLACGSDEDLHVDHIIPRAQGGKTDETNLQTLCRVCNQSKGNRNQADFRKHDLGEYKASPRSPDSGFLIPDSGFLIPDSGLGTVSAEPQSDSPPAITIPLVDKSEFPITDAAVAEWQQAHPKVDVMQQLRQMRVWCIANPNNRKTARGINAFIVRWLGKEQDKGGAVSPRTNPQTSEPQWRTEQRERTQQAAPGVAVKNPKDFFFDSEAKNAIPHLVD